jgi:hypothetical protein
MSYPDICGQALGNGKRCALPAQHVQLKQIDHLDGETAAILYLEQIQQNTAKMCELLVDLVVAVRRLGR